MSLLAHIHTSRFSIRFQPCSPNIIFHLVTWGRHHRAAAVKYAFLICTSGKLLSRRRRVLLQQPELQSCGLFPRRRFVEKNTGCRSQRSLAAIPPAGAVFTTVMPSVPRRCWGCYKWLERQYHSVSRRPANGTCARLGQCQPSPGILKTHLLFLGATSMWM